MTNVSEQLQQIWHSEIPISAAMGIEVVEFANDRLLVRAPLAPNVNVHGTAFAGSLYAVAALCGWGMTWLQLRRRDVDASIVIADGHIHYAAPVNATIEAACEFTGASLDAAMARLISSGKTRFALECSIRCSGVEAARFSGDYAVRLRLPDPARGIPDRH
jgi:thioesterase domain-containing protein